MVNRHSLIGFHPKLVVSPLRCYQSMAGYPFPGGGQPTTRPCGGQERVSIEDGDLFQDFSGLQTKNCAAEMHQLRHICGARDF